MDCAFDSRVLERKFLADRSCKELKEVSTSDAAKVNILGPANLGRDEFRRENICAHGQYNF